MRKCLLILSAGLIITACSAPKYTYHFDRYDYQSGRKNKSSVTGIHPTQSPLVLSDDNHVASTSPAVPVVVTESFNKPGAQASGSYRAMTRAERKTFRKEVKTQIHQYAKALKSGKTGTSVAATKELDDELKLAIIFGAVGITLTVLGGINTIFWVLGIVGLVIGLVFFVRWIQTQ